MPALQTAKAVSSAPRVGLKESFFENKMLHDVMAIKQCNLLFDSPNKPIQKPLKFWAYLKAKPARKWYSTAT